MVFFSGNKKYLYTALTIFSLVAYSFVVYAAAPHGGYLPGGTLNPQCAPNEVSPEPCIVQLPAGGSGNPAGSDTEVQFNNHGAFGSSNIFTFSNNTLSVYSNVSGLHAAFMGSGLNDLTPSGAYTGQETDVYLLANEGNTEIDLSGRTGGTFNGGETVTGGTSGATGTIVFDGAQGGVTQVYVTNVTGSFVNGETITGGTSGVTGTVTGTSVLGADLFAWFESHGSGPVGGVGFLQITGSVQSLGLGLSVQFGATTGHTAGTLWAITMGTSTVGQINTHVFNGDELQFNDGSSHTLSFVAPTLSQNLRFVLPSADGSNGQVLTTDSHGNLSWSTPSGGGGGGSYIPLSQRGANNGVAVLDGNGKVPLSELSALAINNTYVVTSEPDMLALSAHIGDVAVRTDINETFILAANDPTVLSNWIQVLTPPANVTSVNGQVGNVNLTTTDVSEGANLYFTNGRVDTELGSYLAGLSGYANGKVLSTNGSGTFSWVSQSSGGGGGGGGGSGAQLIGSTSGNTTSPSAGGSSETWLGDGAGAFGGSTNYTLFLGVHAGDGATNDSYSNFLGAYAGSGAMDATFANFIGNEAGHDASNANYSNFMGAGTGSEAVRADNSNFFGNQTGVSATNANDSNFFGQYSGTNATNANDSNFMGAYAGTDDLNANSSNFFGNHAGYTAINANDSNFFGPAAGYGAVNADNSNFFGYQSGESATNANDSNFFGPGAGRDAANAQESNFFGSNAGNGATNARMSTFIGLNAGILAVNAADSIFIGNGTGASDTVDNYTIPGQSILIGDSASTGGYSGSIGLGTGATNTMSHQFLVASAYKNWQIAGVDYVWPTVQATGTEALVNDGSGNLSWAPSLTGLTFAGSSGPGGPSGTYGKTWLGINAGSTGNNVYSTVMIGYGTGAGSDNVAGSVFIGDNSGANTSAAYGSTFVGIGTGQNVAAASSSSFGSYAGANAVNAGSASFFGAYAGGDATNAASSTFLGTYAGNHAANAAHSIFIGYQTGINDTVDNTVSGNSILIGDGASTGGFSNSIALGTGAVNTTSNQFLVASAYNKWQIAGVNYVWPGSQAGAAGDVLTNDGFGNLSWTVSNNWALTGNAGTTAGTNFVGTTDHHDLVFKVNGTEMGRFYDNPTGTPSSVALGGGAAPSTVMFVYGYGAGVGATGASDSNFLGYYAGNGATSATQSNFLGTNAGNGATGANQSNFIGAGAGGAATGAYFANFLGYNAGGGATSAHDSNIMGYNAGYRALSADNANFFGASAGAGATGADHSNFLGHNAGNGATTASHANFFGTEAGSLASNAGYSIFLGDNTGSGATNAFNSIFIGDSAGYNDTVNNTSNNGTSILIGYQTNTGGFSNSIALGRGATNTATNQFVVGSVSSPINQFVMIGSGGASCSTNANGTACSSDQRLKTNIVDLPSNALDTLTKVRTVTFNWIAGGDTDQHLGFIAQDMEQYYPQLVSTASNGYLTVNYAGIAPVLVESIRELNLKLSDIQKVADGVDPTFLTNLKNWFASATNGIGAFFADSINAKQQICVDGECLTKDDVHNLIQMERSTTPVPVIVPSSGGSPSPAVDSSTSSDPVPAPTTSDSTSSAPVVVPPPVVTPDVPTPDAAPVPADPSVGDPGTPAPIPDSGTGTVSQ